MHKHLWGYSGTCLECQGLRVTVKNSDLNAASRSDCMTAKIYNAAVHPAADLQGTVPKGGRAFKGKVMSHSLYYQWGVKAAENARSLAEESRLLMNAGRFPRAYYLAHMSTEESAKSILLYAASLSGVPESAQEVSKIQKLLQNHRKKIEFLITHAATLSNEFGNQIKTMGNELVGHINNLKNNTMYVSYSNKKISTPIENIDSVDTELYVNFSEVLSFYAIRLLEKAKN